MRSRSKTNRITLKEIAQLAGVSVTTASYALSGKGETQRISPAVVERVLEIARGKDYAPNLLVRSMQSGRTNILGFYSSFRTHPHHDLYYSRLICALEEAAGTFGYNLLIYCRPEAAPEEVYGALNGGMCDGVVFFGPTRNSRLLELLRQSRLPSVILNHEDDEGQLTSVGDDWKLGMRIVAETLVANGHRSIGAVTSGPETVTDAAQRIAELRHQLGALGAPMSEDRIVELKSYSEAGAEEALHALLNRDDPPTAVFCWHDLAGYVILGACERIGISVPDRLSLIGYDGIHWQSHSTRQLTSIRVDLEAQVQEAVRLADAMIRGTNAAPIRESYPVTLEPGATMAPLI